MYSKINLIPNNWKYSTSFDSELNITFKSINGFEESIDTLYLIFGSLRRK